MYKNNLMLVIKYLKGEIDIYDGKHENVIMTWNDAWDEIICTGYNPQSITGIQKYITDQL